MLRQKIRARKIFGVDRRLLECKLLTIQVPMGEKPNRLFRAKEWMDELEECPLVQELLGKLLSCFGSTHVCESTFSKMNGIKSIYRSCLSDFSLSAALRCAVSSYEPDLDALSNEMQAHPSH